MSTAEREHRANATFATEESPETGSVRCAGVFIAAASRWLNPDGAYVIQASEFDVHGVGATWEDALEDFWNHAVDVFEYIAELEEERRITEDETRIAVTLGPRLVEAYQAWGKLLEKELQDRRTNLLSALHLSRRQTTPTRRGTWQPDPRTRRNSERLSHA